MIVKAITFDLGGTLIESKMDLEGYYVELAKYLQAKGYDIGLHQLKAEIDTALANLSEMQKEGREKTFEEVYREVLSRFQIEEGDKTLKEIREIFRTHSSTTAYPCVNQLLCDLSEKYKLGLISNSIHSIPREIVAEMSWEKYFSVVVISRDVGFRKPRPEIFRRALNLLGEMASDTLHVGDRIDADVYGASAVGMTPIWVNKRCEATWRGFTIENICELPALLEKVTDKDV